VLKDLPAKVARHHPVRGRHSIWELALHTAYWKYIVRRRITGDESLTFPRTGANFPVVPARGSAKEWRADLRLLDQQHRLLHEAVATFSPSRLDRKRPRAPWTFAEEIQGAAAHDLFHAGQMMMLRRMQGL
jgi:DinB family protein